MDKHQFTKGEGYCKYCIEKDKRIHNLEAAVKVITTPYLDRVSELKEQIRELEADLEWEEDAYKEMRRQKRIFAKRARERFKRNRELKAKLNAVKQWGSVLEYELNKSFPEIYSTNRETWLAIQKVLRQLNELRKVLEGE